MFGFGYVAVSTLPFCSIFVIAVSWALTQAIHFIRKKEYKDLLVNIFSIPNVSVILPVFFVFLLFFTCNTAVNGSAGVGGMGWYIKPEYFTIEHLKTLILFYIIEFLCYSVLCYKEYRKDVIFYAVNISLFIFPLFRIGTGRDFCMRASISALFILMVIVIKKFCMAQEAVL